MLNFADNAVEYAEKRRNINGFPLLSEYFIRNRLKLIGYVHKRMFRNCKAFVNNIN